MARRGINGQLNMFDFIKSLETMPSGEVEMVSLMPQEEAEAIQTPATESEVLKMESVMVEPEVHVAEPMVVEPETFVPEHKKAELEPVKVVVTAETPVMCRSYEQDGVHVEIAYLKYNKVRIQRGDAEPEIKEFGSSKEAVDYYVEQMQELEADE